MRRIAVVLLALGLLGIYWACSTDAPAPTPPNQGGGGTKSTPLVITLFTTDANPTAGSCTLIQAIVNFNGQAVADGTGVSFSTDFGVFAQNGQPVVSIVTSKGSAVAALCSSSTGPAFVTARVTVNGVSAKSDQLKIVFQGSALQLPFITSCSPSFGSNTGGTILTINGGRFPSDPNGSNTRATVTAAGITREALVQSVTSTAVTLVTPAFPEATAPSVPVSITLTFFANTSSPVTLAVPNCFAYGTAGTSTPTISALLPSSGTNEGGTRVSVIGTGFSAPVQVFFGTVEAQVVSVTFSQIVVISPQATSNNNLNNQVTVRVHEVTSGLDDTALGQGDQFRYLQPVQITAYSNNVQRIDEPFTTVTISGLGFQAPVAVTLAGAGAFVTSVSATEIQVIPGPVLFDPSKDCSSNITGQICVTDIDTGNGVCAGSFTYVTIGTVPCFTPTPTRTPVVTATPLPPADVAVTKTGPSTIPTGSDMTFGISVNNIGGLVANAVSLTDTLPAGMTFVSCATTQGSCSLGGSTVTANLGTINGGGISNVTIVVHVTAPPGDLTNCATATTTSAESRLDNNTSCAKVTVQ